MQKTERARWDGLYDKLDELNKSLGKPFVESKPRFGGEDENRQILASLETIKANMQKLHTTLVPNDSKKLTDMLESLRNDVIESRKESDLLGKPGGDVMTETLQKEITAAVKRGVESSLAELRMQMRSDEGCVEHRNIITLLCLFAG